MSYFAHSAELPAWVGELPEGWKRDWLKWSATLHTDRPSDEEQERLPYISNEDVESWTGRLLAEDPQPSESDGRTFRTDDVLLNKLRPYLAKVYHADFDGISSGELLCLRPSAEVLPRFLFYVLSSRGFIDTIDAESFGTKMPRADWETVGHQPLPLPPLDVQRRIAQFLDDKTERIDALVEKKRALLDRLAEKRQSLITHAVTKGLDPDAPTKPSGVEWLGDVPEHWEVLHLHRLTRLSSGDFLSASEIEDSGPYPVYGGNGLRGRGETFNTVGRTVIIGRQGAHCGNVHITEEKAHVTEHSFRCLPNKRLHNRWLAYMLEVMNLGQYSVSAAQPGLSSDRLLLLPTVLPPLGEQEQIADHLASHEGAIIDTSHRVAESIDKLNEYRAALVTAAVTGQIEGLR